MNIKLISKVWLYLFTIVGVLSGLVLFIWTLLYLKSETWAEIYQAAKDDYSHVNIDGAYDLLVLTNTVGAGMAFFSALGFFSILIESKRSFWVYTIYIAGCTLLSSLVLLLLFARRETIKIVLTENARSVWLLRYGLVRDLIEDFQRKNACCGWFNALDYCFVLNSFRLLATGKFY
ncbi:Oidioi.mRNA.OKI2018_I69.XSR.g13549.t1.cds [Oikopleura dioica]|uniref:Oidioi.mRNA.OKI2018_I69.XSR.g13549.t1.cds n=1 Tax=Oikopleura dioica TaxID=34765 RepID=A0ABN7SAY0_OIKDI|nr:Oidioi.mRNA.OKI2018_I69.XSR.g13549.t1.cds [Oikopleura dioica]